jgi:hypothetical protein
MELSHSLRRMILGLAALVLVLGVGAALLLPPRYLGPCSVSTEFHCGYQPRTVLRWLLGVGAGVVWVALMGWAGRLRPRSD